MADRMDRIKQPICKHKPFGYVESGDAYDPAQRHASTVVCNREACIQDAKDWAEVITHKPARHVIWENKVKK